MTKLSASGRPAWQEQARMQLRHCAMRGALKSMTMRMLACYLGLLGLTMGFAPFASAQDIGGVIALPDAPFVIPVQDRTYTFPDYRSDDVLTQRNDNNRSGASYVRGLNQNSVRGIRKLGEFPVQDDVLAQPLYIHEATVNDVRQPVLIVATKSNSVYAFPPANPSSPANPDPSAGKPLWHTELGARFEAQKDNGAFCGSGPVGIEATPVIDLEHKRVLVSYKTADATQHLAALDLNHGDVVRDVIVSAGGPDWPRLHRNRASLLLANGVVYVAFAGLCEGPEFDDSPQHKHSFHGSIFAFETQNLEKKGFFPVIDDHTDGGGIWQGSTGIAADTIGNLYFATGNRRPLPSEMPTFDRSTYSNSVIRLKVEKIGTHNRPPRPGEPYTLTMEVGDYFSPYRKIWQDYLDMDLGSAGVLLIPRTRYLVAGGKESILYILDRANMGWYDDTDDEWHLDKVKVIMDRNRVRPADQFPDDRTRDNVHQKFPVGINQYKNDPDPLIREANQPHMQDWGEWPHIHGTPVFARFFDENAFLFVWPEKDRLKRYVWRNDQFTPAPPDADPVAPPVFAKGSFWPHRPEPKDPTKNELNVFGTGMPGGVLSVNIDPSGSSLGIVLASVRECRPGAPFHPELTCSDPSVPKCKPQTPPYPELTCGDQSFGALRAFDPMTMKEIWNNCGVGAGPHKCDDISAGPDDYRFAQFVPPTIAAGRVFLATASGKVIVYGP